MRAISPLVRLHAAGTDAPPLPPGGLALAIESSEAFGDGSHPTTRLCAGAVDFLCRQKAPHRFLDVGTGNGVLARIARARGASFVAGTDTDPASLNAARINAALDSHHRSIELACRAPDLWGEPFDLIAANILEGPLRNLAPALIRALAPGGTLLISGFTPLQTPMLRLAFSGPWTENRESLLEGWALLLFKRT